MIIQRLHQCGMEPKKNGSGATQKELSEADFDFNQTQRLCELDSSELTSPD